MMKWLGNIFGYSLTILSTIMLAFLLISGDSDTAKSASEKQIKTTAKPNIFSVSPPENKTTMSNNFIHKITVTVNRLEDIKVKEGQVIYKGDIISDRTLERYPLLAKRRQLQIAIQKASVPLNETKQVAIGQFEQERIALQKAQIKLKQITNKLNKSDSLVFKDQGLSEVFEPEKVKAIADLKEQQMMATIEVKEAVSRLNQAQIQHALALSNHENSLYKQQYEVESLSSQLQEVEAQLKDIVVVRSPYMGYVYRVRIINQQDRNLTAEVVLDVDENKNKSRLTQQHHN